MNRLTRKQVQQFILDFLQKRVENFTIKGKQFTCPICKEQSANIFPPDSNKVHCFTPECGGLGDIFDLCRKIDFDGNEDIPDEDIAKMLIDEFEIKTDDRLEYLFTLYKSLGWDLVPAEKSSGKSHGKASNIEKEWQHKSHKTIKEWRQWLKNGLNYGVKGGLMSNTVIVDLDLVPSKLKKKIYDGKANEKEIEEAKKIKADKIEDIKKWGIFDWETITQDTFGGIHFFYFTDEEINKCAFDYKDIHIDIQSDGGQAIIEPSIVGGYPRKISGTEMKKMSKELKELILNSTHSTIKKEVNKAEENIDFEAENIKNLDGNCNNRFTQVGGMLRKFINVKNTEQALSIFNKYMLDDPMSTKSIKGICKSIEKYHEADIQTISREIMDHMQIVQEAHVRDLKDCLGYDPKDLQQALRELRDSKKLYKIKKDLYRFVEDVVWRTDFLTLSKPTDVVIPYFDKYANFNVGSMIVIGARTGRGKSHIAMNMVNDFVKQGICPRLVTTEADSGVGEIAMKMGLKEGDFEFWQTNDPTSVPFSDNEVRIIDWLKAPDSEFFKLDTIYQKLNDQLTVHGGIMIIFAQLKKDDGKFYAENMVEQFASLVAKFQYPEKNGTVDNTHPYFKTTKIRRSKNDLQYLTIPLEYNTSTKELKAQ